LAVLVTVLGVAAASATWIKVAETLRSVEPLRPPTHASAIVWSDRVFETPLALRHWLRARGAPYDRWAAKHPVATALLEHRSTPVAVVHLKARPEVKRRSPRQLSSVSPTHSWEQSFLRYGVLGLLLLVAGASAGAALLPLPLRRRFPTFAAKVLPYRDLLGGGAVALVIGLVVGVALS